METDFKGDDARQNKSTIILTKILNNLAAGNPRLGSSRNLREMLGDEEVLRLAADAEILGLTGLFFKDWIQDSAQEIKDRKPLRV